MSEAKKTPWTVEKTRIWQCAIKSLGMPPAQEALDSLIDHHCELLELAKQAFENLDDDLEERPMRHSLGRLTAGLKHLLGNMIEETPKAGKG